jgi:5-methylcytosine-specific restriction enzyme A
MPDNDQKPLRNPPWNRDELILALHLYLSRRDPQPAKGGPEVRELSDVLNRMGNLPGLADQATYRNANGVYMKLMNFRRFDPEYAEVGKVGLTRGNKDEEVVWRLFASDPARLSQVAGAIRAAVEEGISAATTTVASDVDDFAEAPEGRVLTRLHRTRERSRKLVDRKKSQALKEHGRLQCEACAFNFAEHYGDHGDGYIECHHVKPVHELQPGERTKLSDLALVCANCHRMIHRLRPWLSLEQLQLVIHHTRTTRVF